MSPAPSSSSFKERYLARLGLGESHLLAPANDGAVPLSYDTLCLITEAHLATIPFGNLSQHGCPHSATITTESTARKLLDCQREGFCYESNILLARLLRELGFTVQLFDAQVAKGNNWTPPVHVWLLVTAAMDDSEKGTKQWYVDVGFGEPAIHPLEYVMDKQQTTPEGMQSRFVQTKPQENGDEREAVGDNDEVVLEWKQNGVWEPRLKWSADLASNKKEPQDFAGNLQMVLTDKLPFHHKYVVVKVTRSEKVSLAGHTLKRTSPRFVGGGDEETTESGVTTATLDSMDAVRQTLEEEFGIPHSQTEGLDWSKSLQAPPHLWSQF